MNRSTWVLILALLLQVTLWLLHPKPFIASDPLGYALHAHSIASGTFFASPPDHIFAHRLGVILPVAGIYSLFGVSPTTTYLWPLGASLLVTVLLWFAAPAGPIRTTSVFLFAFSVPRLVSTAGLYPDIIVTALMFAAALLVRFRVQKGGGNIRAVLVPLASAVMLSLAFLTKATAVWLLPFLTAVCLADAWHRRSWLWRFWLPFLIWGLVCLGLYLYLCNYLWGTPWARLESIGALSGDHLWSGAGGLLSRLTYEPLQFLNRVYFPAFALSVAGLILLRPALRFWAGYYLITLFVFWFGSATLSAYEPLPLMGRMILPALPPMCLLAGGLLGWVRERCLHASGLSGRQWNVAVLGLLILFLDAGIWWIGREAGAIVAIATAVAAMFLVYLHRASRRRPWLNFVLPVTLAAFVAAPVFAEMSQWPHISRSERDCMDVLKQIQAETDGSILVLCTEDRSPLSLVAYFGFSYPKHLTVRYLGESNAEPASIFRRVLLFRHSERERYHRQAYGLPRWDRDFHRLALLPCLYDRAGVQLCEAAP